MFLKRMRYFIRVSFTLDEGYSHLSSCTPKNPAVEVQVVIQTTLLGSAVDDLTCLRMSENFFLTFVHKIA